MIALVASLALWAMALGLLAIAWRRRDGTAREALKRAVAEFLWLLPRLAIAIIAAGFLATLLPEEAIAARLGQDSGALGVLVAAIAGALTPGGPVVGFSVAAVALKAGAGLPQVMAYVSAWSLLALHRVVTWEAPILPGRFVWLRIAVSLPLPLIVGGLALLLG